MTQNERQKAALANIVAAENPISEMISHELGEDGSSIGSVS